MPVDDLNHTKTKILLLGPQSLLISGTRIPFRQLRKCLEARDDVEIIVVDTDRIRGTGAKGLPRLVKLVAKLFWLTRKCDVISVHFSVTGIPFLGPFVVLTSRFWKRPVVSRQIGGLYYRHLTGIKARITGWFINQSRVYLVETLKLKHLLEADGIKSVRWYPNSRPLPNNRPQATIRSHCSGQFVFVGQLKVEKGLRFLVEAVEGSDLDMTVHVYGPWHDLPRDTFTGCKRVFYKGELKPEEVLSVIEQYEALVIPTFLPDEGYSGVIIEAYQVGRPVIGTRWNALPEIISDGETGLLVEPRDAVSLRNAFARLMDSPELYQKLAKGALEAGRKFSIETRADELVSICRSLVAHK